MKKVLIVILGPTASGKTKLAINLAKKFNGEIICADSRSVYKKLDIGTAKPTKAEQVQVPHHLLDIAEPGGIFTVAQFQKLAYKKIDEIFSRNKIPFLVGGSGLYIDSVIYGLTIPKIAPDWKLRKILERESTIGLFARIRQWDPDFAEVVDKNNKRRLIRAIEVMQKTHQKFSDLRQKNPLKIPILILGIDIPRARLVKNIDERVGQRISIGMIKEVKDLVKKDKVDPKWLDNLGLEYRYLSRYVLGKLSREEAIAQLKTVSHQFARRQMTWFKKNKDIVWIKNRSQAEKEIVKFLSKIGLKIV
jgi:tRNA dimethylallyltransferase